MSAPSKLCIVCNKGETSKKKLVNNPEMVKTLINSINERISLGKTDLQPIILRYNIISDSEQKDVLYHSECRKPLVNTHNKVTKIPTFKRTTSPSGETVSQGNPSASNDPARPKRQKCERKSKVCIFSPCEFCSGKTSDELHLVKSNNVGLKLIQIKNHTKDDHVRTCVSDLYDFGDAAAQEKYYHDHCLLYAERTCISKVEDHSIVHSAIFAEELLVRVQNTLISKIPLNMNQVHEAYKEIMR